MDRTASRELQVDGNAVTVTPHRARAGARLMAKVGRAIAPAFSKIVSGATISKVRDGAELGPDDVELGDIDGAIEALFAQLTDQAVDALILEILAHTTIVLPGDDGTPRLHDLSKQAEIDAAFTGQLPLMFRVMAQALKVNFLPFFSGTGGFGALFRALAASATSPSTSPAPSGQSGTATS